MDTAQAMTTNPNARVRLHGKIPQVRTIMRSEAMLVRDGMIDRLVSMPAFDGFTFKPSHAFKVLAAEMPVCAVYFMGEQLGADGDANAGEVRFDSVVRIGFS